MNEEIQKYITDAKSYGLSDGEIEKNLRLSGWGDAIIAENFAEFNKPKFSNGTNPVVKDQKTISVTRPNESTLDEYVVNMETKTTTVPKKSHKLLILGGIILLLVLGAGGYAAAEYFGVVESTYVFNYTDRLWEKFVSEQQNPIYTIDYSLDYKDSPPNTTTFAISGTSYTNGSNAANPESQGEFTYNLESSGNTITATTPYKVKDQTTYLQINDNPLVTSLFQTQDSGWVKIASDDEVLTQLKDAFGLGNTSEHNILGTIWKKEGVVQSREFNGYESVGDTKTAHYTLAIDSAKFKNALAGASTGGDDQGAGSSIPANSVLQPIEIKKIELWIGTEDYQLYRLTGESNAPSITSLINQAQVQSKQNESDIIRLEDARAMSAALERYFNDFGGYPGSAQGAPFNLVPQYIDSLPIAPKATGRCTDYYNTYWYTATGTPTKSERSGENVFPSYTFTFCLGKDAGDTTKGIATMTPQGINTTLSCEQLETDCLLPETTEDEPAPVFEQLQTIPFTASLTIDAKFSGLGTPKEIEIPPDAQDLTVTE